MLTGSKGMTPGNAKIYFENEDYYMKGGDTAEWVGEGAKALGLEGSVETETREMLLNGIHPYTGEQLVQGKITIDKSTGEQIETHRGGNDWTFSAPKSVSVAYAAGVDGIKECHDAAVRSLAVHFEDYYSHARTPDGTQSGSLVATKFDHATSRALDPQLHSHMFIYNMTQTDDGQWRANEPRNIYRDQKKLGELYRLELAKQLQKRGYEIEYTNREHFIFDLKGVDANLVEKFSQRREAIEQQVKQWIDEERFKGVAHARLYEMAALKTRDVKDTGISKEDVSKIWDAGFADAGTSKAELKHKLESMRHLNMSKLPEQNPNQKTAIEVVRQATAFMTDKEAVLDRANLLQTAATISGDQHTLADLNGAIDSETVLLGQAKGRYYCTTEEMQLLEARNTEALKALPKFNSVTSREEVINYLDMLEKNEGIKLTYGQRQHVLNELAGSNGSCVTQGDPGTGKTFASSIIERYNTEVLEPSGRQHYTINVAYTGKAASEMSEASGRDAYTIDSFLNAYHAGKIKEDIPSSAQIILRVDEASFVGAKQADHLINVVNDLNKTHNVKLELLGDTKQMQSIQSGDFFRQAQNLSKTGDSDSATLKEINRQKNPELLEVATILNKSGNDEQLSQNASDALLMLKNQGCVTEVEDRESLMNATVDKYMDESAKPSPNGKDEPQSVLLITALNTDRIELNQRIRDARIEANQIDVGNTYEVLKPVKQGTTSVNYEQGQLVQFTGERREDGKMYAWGAPLYTEGVVTNTNAVNNTVTIKYNDHTKVFDATELANKTTMYEKEERNFSAGDKVVFLKNDKNLDVKNGQIGELNSLDDVGNATVKLQSGKHIELNIAKYGHIDHAYAVTVHKSQGATVDCSIQLAHVRPEGMNETSGGEYGKASYNALNVAVTRARYDAHIMTNSLAGFEKSVQSVDHKTTTLDVIYNGKPKSRARLSEKIDDLNKLSKTTAPVPKPAKPVSKLDAQINALSQPKKVDVPANDVSKAIQQIERTEQVKQMVNDLQKGQNHAIGMH